jgi:thiamine-phosphate pyrophosphorylase
MPRPLLDVFYPIVPDIAWLHRLVPLGVRTIQLRLKDASHEEMRRQVREGLALCRRHGADLVVNDDWRAAIAEGARHLHLGQEDLAEADLAAIRAAGIRLGISTHTVEELAVALRAEPAYVALGPIWETKLKPMRYGPQGLDTIRDWRRRIGTLPLCAIGGITPERADGVMAAGADSCAVITDFFTAADPEARVRGWLDWAERVRPRAA